MNLNDKTIQQLIRSVSKKPTLVGILVLAVVLVFVFLIDKNQVQPPHSPLVFENTNQEKEIYLEDGIYYVEEVIDGDTIYIETDGDTESVRLIGINTPETVDPRTKVECFGVEASNKTKALLEGQEVRIESDPAKGDRDQYDRLLRYVFLQEGTNVNKLLVEQGFAHENSYGVPYRYEFEFKQAQATAQKNKYGLWADGVCPAQ